MSENPNNPWWYPQNLSPSAYSVRIDEFSDTIVYVGHADPGSSESDSVWRIKKINLDTISVTFADGDSEFDNSWSDRYGLEYS